MNEEKFIMLKNRLEKVSRHLGRQAKRLGVNCYRVYDHDLPEFPVCIEFYGNKLYMAEYKRRHGMTDEEHDVWMEKTIDIISEVLLTPKNNIFLKLRQRKPGRLGQYQRLDKTQHEFIIEENGLKFIINLSDYLDTGLFLDHRLTRQMIKEQSAGKRVLNLFAYTGSFSVYAAAGGATEVVTVDLSKNYLDWAQRNMYENGFSDSTKFKFVHTDVIQYLKEIAPSNYDIVIMDPPTFSNSKRMKGFLEIQRDHVRLINDCLTALSDNGVLYFSTNFRKFIPDKKNIKASVIKDLTTTTTPFDFEGKLFRYCYKVVK
jgi:23S rRNA (guanine2069-N7)-methyltransferase